MNLQVSFEIHKMLQVIYHISDIHLIERNFVNILNSFNRLVNDILCDTRKSILVIAGDIFEHKNTLYTNEIQVFIQMMKLLEDSKIKTLIIPGNHDCNVNLTDTIDNITLLNGSNSDYIKVYNHSGKVDGLEIFGFDNVDFYVYSLIDKKIPKVENNERLKIAICHDQVENAKYYNNTEVKNAPLSIKDFKQYDITLLGDIHKCQFLTDTMAYCGSFVQKNKGEDLNHGYILWNLECLSGEFKIIPLKEIFLNVYAENDKLFIPDYSSEQKITYFTFKYLSCSKEFIDKTIEELNKIHSLDKIICLDNFVINETNNTDSTNNFQLSHDSIIKESLILSGNSHLTESIIEYHHSKMHQISETQLKNFVLVRLEWSNLYCYGEDNVIDFQNFSNDLIVINGKNKTGKSSFIDILTFILFNKNIRGKRNDIVNKYTKSGYAMLTLQQGNDEYVMYRKKFRKSATDEFTVKKNGVLITKSTIDETYRFIINEIGIGSFENFINLTTALQNRQFLLDSNKNGLVQLINQLVNIDFFDEIENEVKVEKAVLKKLQKEYNIKMEYFKDITEEVLEQEISLCEENSNELKKAKDEKNKLLVTLKELYKDYDKSIGVCEDNVDGCLQDCVFDKSFESYNQEKIQTMYKLKTLRSGDTVETNESILDIEKKLKTLVYKQVTVSNEELDKLEEYSLYLTEHRDDLNVFLEELENCKIKSYHNIPKEYNDILESIENVLRKQKLNKEAIVASFTFDSVCECCTTNEHLVLELDAQNLNVELKTLLREKEMHLENAVLKRNTEKTLRNGEKIVKRDIYLSVQKKVEVIKQFISNQKIFKLENKLRGLYIKNIDELDKKITMLLLKRKLENTKIFKSIQTTESKIERLNEYIGTFKESKSVELYQLEQKWNEKKDLVELIAKNTELLHFFQVYSELIDKKTGIKGTILKNVCVSLEKHINYYLNSITDFQVVIDYQQTIQMYTVGALSKEELIPVELASGFQKFVLDIIIRISLSKMFLNKQFSYLIIDEGFGNLDLENLTDFCNVLSRLRYDFKNIFVITHNEEVKSYGTKFLNVTVAKSGKSKLVNSIVNVIVDNECESEPDIVDAYLEKQNNRWYCKKCRTSFLDSKAKLDNHLNGKKHKGF